MTEMFVPFKVNEIKRYSPICLYMCLAAVCLPFLADPLTDLSEQAKDIQVMEEKNKQLCVMFEAAIDNSL